jgi:hypothetical protein
VASNRGEAVYLILGRLQALSRRSRYPRRWQPPSSSSAVGRTGVLTEKRLNRVDAYRMIRRRTAEAGFKVKLGCGRPGHSRPDLDDLAGSIAASRPFGGCGFARLKAQVVERPELGPVRRRIWLRARLDTAPRYCGLEIGNEVPHRRQRGIPKGGHRPSHTPRRPRPSASRVDWRSGSRCKRSRTAFTSRSRCLRVSVSLYTNTGFR